MHYTSVWQESTHCPGIGPDVFQTKNVKSGQNRRGKVGNLTAMHEVRKRVGVVVVVIPLVAF